MPHAQAGSGKQTGAFWQEVGFLGSRAPCHHMVALQEGQVESALGRTNKIRLARRSRPGVHRALLQGHVQYQRSWRLFS